MGRRPAKGAAAPQTNGIVALTRERWQAAVGKHFTYRLCRMNLFIHGLDGNNQLGNSYFDDRHATLKAGYVLANPPFNDGSKGETGWGADKIPDKDPRLTFGAARMPLKDTENREVRA
jgi:type I restriction-modification system DNA methylase subunit